MHIVADTNVVVSAFLWGGSPRALLTTAHDQTITLWTSPALIAELEEILTRAKLAHRLIQVGSSVEEILGDYLALTELVRPSSTPSVIARDPDDDHVLACAVAARADLIVSGDAHLLELERYQNIRIVTPTAALTLIAPAPR